MDFNQEEACVVPKNTEKDKVVELSSVAIVHATYTAANEESYDASREVTCWCHQRNKKFPFDPGIDENEAENEENYVDVQNKKEENQVI